MAEKNIGGSRRWFLNEMLNVGKGFIALSIFPTSGDSLKTPTLKFGSELNEYEPACEIVDGVKVYGTMEQFETKPQVQKLYDYFEKQFQVEAKNKGFGRAIPKELIDKYDRLEAVLDPDKRFLQIIVPRSLFQAFQSEGKNGELGLVQWINEHVKEMNRMISDLRPQTDLKTEIKRVIVVSDSFTNDKDQNLPDAPWDVDAFDQSNLWQDPRKVSSFVGEKVNDKGQKVKIDYGLIHEWFHLLYAVPDEYRLDIERTMGIPDFFVIGDGLLRDDLPELSKMRRTPWIAWCLKWFKDNGVRGEYRSKKGGGNGNAGGYTNFDELPGNAKTVLAQRPNLILLDFIDPHGEKIEGKIEISSARFPDADSKIANGGRKTINGLRTSELTSDGQFKLEETDFIAKQFVDGSYVSTTNFIFKIKTTEGKDYVLHLPVSAFNMSAIAGKTEAKYAIQFAREQDLDKDKIQILEELNTSEITPDLISNHPPDVRMAVDGTDDFFYWYLFSERQFRPHP